MADYVLEGEKWGGSAFGTAGGTVTWAVSSNVPTAFVAVIAAAFADWSTYADIQFEQVASTRSAGIVFSDRRIDGLDNVLGQTSFSSDGTVFSGASVTFDRGEGWTSVGSTIQSASGVNLFDVALHEIGHAIGLDHYNAAPAVMNAILNPAVTDLATSDIDGVRAIYGPAHAAVAPAPVATTPPAVTVAPTPAPTGQLAFGTVTHDPHGAGGTVYALYDALLGRAPDALGLEYWADAFGHGVAPSTLAAAFLASPEGQARAGAVGDAAFVTQLYNATLHRGPDAAGLSFWTADLAHGDSRADVGVAFALSAEHLAGLQPVLDAGVFVPDPVASEVARIYYTVLGRAPDAAGLQYWGDAIRSGVTLAAETQSILQTPEVQAKTSALSTSQYVDLVYTNALGRHADAAGLAFWTNAIDTHAAGRVDVTTQIGEGPEAQAHLAPLIELGWHLA